MIVSNDIDYTKYYDENPLISENVIEDILNKIKTKDTLYIHYQNIEKMSNQYYLDETNNSTKNRIRKNMLFVLPSFLNKAYSIFDDFYMYQLVYFLVATTAKPELILMSLNDYFKNLMKKEIKMELTY